MIPPELESVLRRLLKYVEWLKFNHITMFYLEDFTKEIAKILDKHERGN